MPAASTKPAKGEFRGIHMAMILVGFFAVTIGVNAVFITRAVTSFPGEDVPNSYVQGLDYNRALEQREQQQKLGWQAEAGLEQGMFVTRIRGADGAPVTGLSVTAQWRQVGRDKDEHTTPLSERAPGEYAASLGAASHGRLAISVEAAREAGGPPVFTAAKTLETQ